MSELATIPQSQELLSARDIATLLKISRQAVQKRMSRVAPQLRDGILAWPFDLLPHDYQLQLKHAKDKAGAWTFEDLIRIATPRWVADFKLSELPAFSQTKAHKVRAVMIVYSTALDAEKDEREANCDARSSWLAEFEEACSERTIRRWAKKIDERGGVEWAPIEAYADRKSLATGCAHINARLESREKKQVPGELIRAFKALCVMPDMNVAAAHRKLEMDWQVGREVPGIGKMEEARQPFPFKVTQLRKFAPSMGARKLGNRGNAEARRDALPYMTRTHEQLRACELFVMDDTRINVTVMNDINGFPAQLKCYIAMEVASRKIVGYVIREGNMRASDVDALMSRILRTCGLARRDSGYKSTFLFERGTVACSDQKQALLEAMFPGQIEIRRTSMDGGRNMPGDYAQAASGHWMGKGVIESFMRTLGYITRHIDGQRGSNYRVAPAMVGYPGKKGAHAGSMVDEAQTLIKSAMAAAYFKSNGAETSPHAREAVEAMGLEVPTMFVSEFRQAFALSIMAYNQETDHRREGFRQVGEPKENGGYRYRFESSDERWTWLNWNAEQQGKAPERITPQDAVMLLHKAQSVTVTRQGATITVDEKPYRYWKENSLACLEADRLSTLKKEFIAVRDPDDLSEIYILRNGRSFLSGGEVAQFLECLPMAEKPGFNDAEAKARVREKLQFVSNRKHRELARAAEPFLQKREEANVNNISRLDGVITTTNGECRVTSNMSDIGKQMRLGKAKSTPTRSQNGRDHQAGQDDVADFAASLNSTQEAP